MLELLATTAVLFLFFFFLFFFFEKFIIMKIIIIIIQFILYIVLLTNTFYKKQFLWKGMKYETVYELSFNPVYEIKLESNDNGKNNYLVINTLNDRKYSLIKTEKYSKKCLENYYINSELECPIT